MVRARTRYRTFAGRPSVPLAFPLVSPFFHLSLLLGCMRSSVLSLS